MHNLSAVYFDVNWKAQQVPFFVYTAWFKKIDSISYIYIAWTKIGIWMIYITFEREDPKFSNTTAILLA